MGCRNWRDLLQQRVQRKSLSFGELSRGTTVDIKDSPLVVYEGISGGQSGHAAARIQPERKRMMIH